MTNSQNAATVLQMLDAAWNRGDTSVLHTTVAEDHIDHDDNGDDIGRDHLVQAILAYRAAFPDMRMSFDDQIADGDKVVTRWTANGTHQGQLDAIPATGRLARISGIFIHQLTDGEITESWTSFDRLGLLQQLGVIPSADSAPTSAPLTLPPAGSAPPGRDGRRARSLLWNLQRARTRVRLVWADAGYAAAKLATWAAALRLTVQIVAKRDPHALQVWVVERTLCAARRFAVSPAQPGGIRREVPGSNGLPGSERLRGQQHARKPGGRVQWSGTARRGDPRDMAKAGLPESQSPVDASSHPPERPLKPAPCSASESKVAGAPPEHGATPSEGVQGDEWGAYVTLTRTAKTNAGSPAGREPQGDGGLVVVAGVTTGQGGRESRPQGEGGQVIGHRQIGRYA